MSEPFLGQISMFGFNWPPRGFALCDGQLLPIVQNQSLFALLGTTFGGDGKTTFQLPDLRSRVPMHRGDTYRMGVKSGVENVTLTTAQMPAHSHAMKGTAATGDRWGGANNRSLATSPDPSDPIYHPPTSGAIVQMAGGLISNAGGGLGHNNIQPSQVISFCIAMQGIFPSRS